MTLGQRMARLAKSIMDLLAPRQCEICGRRLGIDERLICTLCNASLPRTNDIHNPYDNNTARLFWGRFPIERCAAFVRYVPHSDLARMIYRMKYGGRDDIGEQMGQIIAHDYKRTGFFDGIDLLVPMPLHPKRIRQRGYNQCLEIARGINYVTGIPIDDSIIMRKRNTKSQATMHAHDRAKNMDDAFALGKAHRAMGKHLLLIDDIVTTGATLSACAYELAKIENVRISILTIGHTES